MKKIIITMAIKILMIVILIIILLIINTVIIILGVTSMVGNASGHSEWPQGSSPLVT